MVYAFHTGLRSVKVSSVLGWPLIHKFRCMGELYYIWPLCYALYPGLWGLVIKVNVTHVTNFLIADFACFPQPTHQHEVIRKIEVSSENTILPPYAQA